MIRAGARLVARRRPDPAPCPWCDLAFPRPKGSANPSPGAVACLVAVSSTGPTAPSAPLRARSRPPDRRS
ncbi:MAG: hypothetical protein M3137_11950 [Actinomycetota bacterium]|nr:hypothetical protein [Actinomycetota bacterium]